MALLTRIDGAAGEGGGQILRSSLALSLLTSTPFRMTSIRARREKPGLRRQHLVAVEAARDVSDAKVTVAVLGSTEITFEPRGIRGGDHTFVLGTAGSTTLVFQTVFFPLLLGAKTPSRLAFEGGTDNPMAPPFEFLAETFLGAVGLMTDGASLGLVFERHGFYPAGGGRFRAEIQPASGLRRLELTEPVEITNRSATAIVSKLPHSIAEREIASLVAALGWPSEVGRAVSIDDALGPGNVLWAKMETNVLTEVVSACGERGVSAEKVARKVADAARRFERANVPVGEHLADQLVLPMALGKGGSFRTLAPSSHCTTQIELVKRFLDRRVEVEPLGRDVALVHVDGS